MYATRDGQTAIAKLFISKGADLNVQNDVSSIIIFLLLRSVHYWCARCSFDRMEELLS